MDEHAHIFQQHRGRLCGVAYRMLGSRSDAESVALANCGEHAKDCVVPIWFRNACGALAVGSSGYGSGWGTSREFAESYALKSCREHTSDCYVKRWACTTR